MKIVIEAVRYNVITYQFRDKLLTKRKTWWYS